MFAAGLAKYGERVWALKCGNISSITSSFDKSEGSVRVPEPLDKLPRDGGEIESMIADLYKLVEMELSLMYDILYTKAAVIHTWIRLKMLPDAIIYLRWRVSWPARRRLWSGSIGQYNLLDMSVSDRKGILCWLAKKLGLQHWWNELHFSDTFSGKEFCSVEDLKVLVWREMVTRDTGANSRGSAALQRNNFAGYNWSVNDMDLDRSILVWHIVTDLVIRLPRGEEKVNKRLAEVTKVLSNYMMFLLVVKPDMLPGRTRRNLYLNACKELNCHWSDCSKEWSPMEEAESLQQADTLAHWLLCDSYHKLQKHDPSLEKIDIEGRGEEAPEHAKDVYNAIFIYETLRSNPHDEVTWLEIIFQVWVEMILYVAEHCSRDSHARQLSYGGEFITIMWLMVPHLKYYSLHSNMATS
ncbi:unnamed protein product [Urochloa humidicola]